MTYYSDDHLTVHQGDCREVMASMEPESVHCVVTSPPYWGLRDYGTATWIGGDDGCDHVAYRATCGRCGAVREDGQLGLESTPEAYVASMVDVFREVRRVLRDDGTLWLNLGDSYANDTKWGGSTGGKHVEALHGDAGAGRGKRNTGLKPKDLVGIPWRVAFALQADGWYLRSDIIWAKPNPMPESVTDRPTKSHEYLFLLTKSARYYFDADAVRESFADEPHGNYRDRSPDRVLTAVETGRTDGYTRAPGAARNIAGRNIRSVWTIATAPYPGAHFATFPPKLVEPCVKAGCPSKVCLECGAPWERIVDRTTTGIDERRTSRAEPSGVMPNRMRAGDPSTVTTGWRRTCAHDGATTGGVVLDPFAGSGTTGMVAQSLGRRAVLIDLNADYLVQAMQRNAQSPLGLDVA